MTLNRSLPLHRPQKANLMRRNTPDAMRRNLRHPRPKRMLKAASTERERERGRRRRQVLKMNQVSLSSKEISKPSTSTSTSTRPNTSTNIVVSYSWVRALFFTALV